MSCEITGLEIARRSREMTQAALARAAGVQAADVCRIERGAGLLVGKRTRDKLAAFLQMPASSLLSTFRVSIQ